MSDNQVSFATLGNAVGFVTQVSGTVKVQSIDGQERIIKAGDPIFYGETVVAVGNGSATIEFVDGTQIVVANQSVVEITDEIFSFDNTDAELVADSTSEADALQEAILAGQDPTLIQEAPAAGEETGATDEEQRVDVSVDRNDDTSLPTFGYDTDNDRSVLAGGGTTGGQNYYGTSSYDVPETAQFGLSGGSGAEGVPSDIKSAQFVDSYVNGVTYVTSSGLSGLTGDQGDDGSFAYREGDSITFSVGDVIIAEFSSDLVSNGLLFLQDIAQTDLGDVNDNYVENMAIFLQAISDGLQDSNSGDGVLETNDIINMPDGNSTITISEDMREAFEGYSLNLSEAGKQMLSDALASVNIEFTRDSETEDGLGVNTFETAAMSHVVDSTVELAGDRVPDEFDARTTDEIDVPGGVVTYNYNELDGEITFSVSDLLEGATANQVVEDNLVIKDVSLAAGYENIGELIDNGDGTYKIILNEGVDQYDLEGLSLNYTAQDWTATQTITSATLDTYKSHLSTDAESVTEGDDYAQFTLTSSLSFDEDQTLKITLTSENMSEALGKQIAEYADDYSMPIEYSVDGGETWISVDLDSVEYQEGGVVWPTFSATLPAGSTSIEVRVPIFDDVAVEGTEYFNAVVTGDNFYDEEIEFAIEDNDSVAEELPTISTDYVYAVEGQEYAEFTVSLSEAADGDVSVDYSMVGIGATLDEDITDYTGTIVFAAGETTKTIRIPIVDDTEVEDVEMAFLTLSNVEGGAVIGDGQGSLRLFDNDSDATLDVNLTIDSIAQDNVIDAAEFQSGSVVITGTVSGDSYDLAIVTLTINGEVYTANIGSDNTYSLTVDTADLQSDGDLTVDAQVNVYNSDSGRGEASASQSYTFDSSPLSINLDVDPITDDSILNAVEAGGDVIVTGSVTGDEFDSGTVTLTINDTEYTGAVTNGQFSISVAGSDLEADSDSLVDATASVSNAIGQSGGGASTEAYFVDTTARATVRVDSITSDDVINSQEAGATITVTGRVGFDAGAGDTVSMEINGTTYTAVVQTDSTWSVDVAGSDLAADASFVASVSGQDDAGNPYSASTTSTHTVDTSIATPSISFESTGDDDVYNAVELGDDGTVTATISVTGSEVGDTLTYRVGDGETITVTLTADDIANGVTVEVPPQVTLTASLSDDAGNTSDEVSDHPMSADVSADSGTVTVNDITEDDVINAAEAAGTVSVTGDAIGGDISEGDVVALEINGTTYTTTVGPDGSWSVDVAGSDLVSDTEFDAVVTSSDDAGNTVESVGSSTHTIDTSPLAINLDIDPITDDSILNAAEAGSDVTVTGSVTGDDFDTGTVTLTINGTEYTGAVTNGQFSISVAGSDLEADSDSLVDAAATVSNAIGQSGDATSTEAYFVDTTARATIRVDSITSDDVIDAEEANSTVSVTGRVGFDASAGDTVTMEINGTTYTATVQADKTWAVDVAGSDLAADTSFVASVSGQDSAGNPYSASTTSTHTVNIVTGDTSLSLSATDSITETGGVVTYTATLTNAAQGDVTVTLSNGETITIADGETQGTVDVVVAADEDVYVDADSISASISGATGGNFENLVVDSTPATTQITDTTDDTTVSLSATGSITEAGGTVTYTAELTSAAEGDVTVTLSNGETITIADGETQGTVDVVVAADEDVYVDADSISASISGATGGNFENLVVDSTPATTQITDTTDDTTVSLSATGSITEAGGTVTYTAELTSAAEGDVTVTLSNGETITIADGETQGTVDVVVAADEDVYVDADSISASISGATGGNFENLVVDSTPATTQITDTTDDTTVSLSATGSITEAGGTVTYTAELTSAAEGDVTVTLSNGETITIADGETQGTVDVVVAADEDVYVDADSISASISGATGGNFENLVVDSTPATTQITDTTDDTTVSLSATGSITEAGGTVTYTAELTSAAEGDVTVTLSNGETITIADGETQGTVDVVVAADEDVYVDADSISASISGATGGNFENLVVDSTPATTQITDTTDDTTVSLSATGSITEAGGTVTYTAELTSAAEGDVTVTLSNGETITIADGETQGTVDVVVAADEDVYVDADSISASISGATGGNFENLVVDSTPATTQITDTTDDTTVSLSATGSITEAGGTVTYTAELTSAAEGDVTVTLSNGETITIADGETQGTVDVVVAADEDVYVDADSISASISGATGGNFENLVVDSTPATTQITDTTDDTTVSLSATGSITEAGGTVTYTAELTSAAEGDVTVTLSNGETITIADGETQGTVDVVVAADEDVYVDADSISASISGATGGNFENLVVDSTPATTQITDTTDDTTVSLSATGSITEAGGTVTYTAELTSAAEGDVTVTLSNGETITIADGETQGTVDVVVAADEDVYVDADSISASISGATGGNFENLVVDSTPATTQITDTTDDTTVSLSATGSITEAGGTVTYTAELTSAAEGDVTVTLSNGETITIADGETQGTVDVVVAADEDVYVDADSISASISGATGGNFENLVVDSTPATTQITDTTDDTTVSLSATGSITEAGGTVTYTAELTSAAEGDVTVTLSNGETITIADGETQGTVDVVVAADEDVYVDADSISASISGATGGNFENLVVDSTPATTQITDTTDDTTVSLSATGSITEAGGTVTYTAELTSAAEGDVTVTLSNGETITIADGETQGTVDVVVAADEDVYVDADSISASISGATGGNFENLVVDSTPATTQITDTTDDTTVSLSATGSITEAGGTVTYTAELTSAAEGDVTVTLSNGETITIADGETQGTVDVVVAADEDVYVDADSISASISGATGGNFENLVVDSTPATTQITDTTDDTTVSLSATGSITEAGGTVTYTAELTSAAEGDVTVTLSNGETITIADGETQGTVDVVVAADEDVYVDADSISASISGATGGNFENLVVDSTPATTQITDTTDDTTVSLSATGSITEAGGTVTYTAELTSAAEGDVTVTLSNGETITIADGETQGTVDVVVAADEDVYVDADSISASISGATGGNFENLVVDSTPATTQITDTTDDTTVSLSATGSITEAGGTVTYTAELTSAAEGDVTVTLSNGETITIADGETQGTVDVVVAADEDVYVDADSISASISGATGGNFENLVVDSTPATTQITDTTDDTTVSLSATGSITEAGGTVTYTAELTSAAEGDVTVTLSNGETITIADGETQGTVDVVVAADEDVYVDADSISASISGATGGNFENLVVDSTPATTQITDTTDDTTVSLSATGSITEAGGTVTYTAELTSAAEGDVTVTLSNGETITIADGETQGTVDVVVAADEDVYVDADSISASISGATGGNFENLVVDSTPATTQITDTTDDTTVSLSATGSITEAGGTVTYTAELTSAAEGDVTVTLSNGETITIADGETQGTVDVVVAADEDVYVDADSISASISGATGGNFENLVVDSTPATTQITDTTDDTTVSLSATGSITEAGGTVTYTAELRQRLKVM
ncbi:retention module-containing protein [Marinomonas mediterranea]|uniref:retention module-containing protein n=1 Tax=Marinomonas mediterranea TaxID=119864 RepID=UPI00234AAFA9|nr:retention module-containing protein [Marinomonas mediterranea]WCN13748.1 retention module-containing protein [Marinomonas mediterranea]